MNGRLSEEHLIEALTVIQPDRGRTGTCMLDYLRQRGKQKLEVHLD